MNHSTMQPRSLTWRTGASSDIGRREENQDRMTRFPTPFGEVVAVADGMGGMRGGATAAETCLRQLAFHLSQISVSTPVPDALQQAVQRVNQEIYAAGHSGDPEIAGMGTTLVLAVLRETPAGAEALIGNIGDSPAFLFRGGQLHQLTRDHTAAQRLADAGAIPQSSVQNHPEASILTRAIGQTPEVELELYPPIVFEHGDGLLLCSDGLSGYAAPEDILRALQVDSDPGAVVQALTQTALQCGSDDNITVQYLQLQRPGQAMMVPTASPAASAALPPPPPVRRWKPATILMLAAASVAACFAGVLIHGVAFRPAESVTITVANKTGERFPDSGKLAPVPEPERGAKGTPIKPDPPVEVSHLVKVHSDLERPEWMEQLRNLPCVRMEPRSYENDGWERRAVRRDPRIYVRPGAEAALKCIQAGVPALAKIKAETLAEPLSEPGVSVLILAPRKKPEERRPGNPQDRERRPQGRTPDIERDGAVALDL